MKDVLLAKTQWIPGKGYYLGPHRVGNAFHDGCVPKGSKLCYKAVCLLPGKDYGKLDHSETMEEAKNVVEFAVFDWLQKIIPGEHYESIVE